jgi:hypothetical protein
MIRDVEVHDLRLGREKERETKERERQRDKLVPQISKACFSLLREMRRGRRLRQVPHRWQDKLLPLFENGTTAGRPIRKTPPPQDDKPLPCCDLGLSAITSPY